MVISSNFSINATDIHNKDFALWLVLTERLRGTWKTKISKRNFIQKVKSMQLGYANSGLSLLSNNWAQNFSQNFTHRISRKCIENYVALQRNCYRKEDENHSTATCLFSFTNTGIILIRRKVTQKMTSCCIVAFLMIRHVKSKLSGTKILVLNWCSKHMNEILESETFYIQWRVRIILLESYLH